MNFPARLIIGERHKWLQAQGLQSDQVKRESEQDLEKWAREHMTFEDVKILCNRFRSASDFDCWKPEDAELIKGGFTDDSDGFKRSPWHWYEDPTYK